MFGNPTAKAIAALATAFQNYVLVRREELAWSKSHAITKRDLEAAKDEIVKAFGERVDPDKIEKLKELVAAGKIKVQAAVDDNQ